MEDVYHSNLNKMNPVATSRLLKVILIYDDKTMSVDGSEAKKWANHNLLVAHHAQIHNVNPFQNDPINWTISYRNGAEVDRSREHLEEPNIRVTLPCGFFVDFWLMGFPDEYYIKATEEIKMLENKSK